MSAAAANPDGSTRKRLDMLPRVAQLAAWPTPSTPNGGRSSPNMSATGMLNGKKRQAGLEHVARLTGWATPRAEDAESAGMRHSRGVADTLTAQAGQGATSCHAETGTRAVLRPGHSRWLQGYPVEWCQAAIRAARKLKRAPKRG